MMPWFESDWVMRDQLSAKRARIKNPLPRLLTQYTIIDYGVRKIKEDLWESYNLITGEQLYQAQSESEAWSDLKEEFLKRA